MTAPVCIGPHRLYLGDAYAIRPTLGWMDADVMDPPYAFDNSGGGAFRKSREGANRIVEEGLDRGFGRPLGGDQAHPQTRIQSGFPDSGRTRRQDLVSSRAGFPFFQ